MPAQDVMSRLNAALEGRYRIEGEVGRGGMATVYRADDLRHGRKVALKVLRPELAAVVGADRFLTEIRTTASLQHPHILPLHDSGEADGFLFYVMPYVGGESLRSRLDRERQLPVDESVMIARKVAEALDYAHRQGVIHRDVKPANILMQDGEPMVSDFGIALAVGAAGGGRLTETGMSLGTPHYMSPEQATGDLEVGPTTDVYAVGCVLYEMLVGEPPYTGSTAQAVLGKIVLKEPDSVSEHRSAIPPNVDDAIRRALEKVPADRFSRAGAFAEALGDATFRHRERARGKGRPRSAARGVSLAASLVAVVAIGVAVWALASRAPTGPVSRVAIAFGPGQLPTGGVLSFAPDGALLYTNGAGVWLRDWGDLDARLLPGTQGVQTFAASPDGREIAVSELPGPLRVVSMDGGARRELAASAVGVWTWGEDGYVYFTGPTRSLARVATSGEGSDSVEVLTDLEEGEFAHGFLSLLPGGDHGVFQVLRAPSGGGSQIWMLDLETRERTYLTAGSSPRYSPTGHVLFGSPEGALFAAPLDVGRAQLDGPPVVVAERLWSGNPFAFGYAISDGGSLIYQRGDVDDIWEAVWVTRNGSVSPIEPDFPFSVSPLFFGWHLSPDGTRLVMAGRVDSDVDVWIKELPSGPPERLTVESGEDNAPVWAPDGRSVAYARPGDLTVTSLFRRSADGGGAPELLLDSVPGALLQSRWSPDGTWMLFRRMDTAGGVPRMDIVGFRPGVDEEVVPLVAAPEFDEYGPALSPDGEWLAYSSDETGQQEVYVRPFPEVDSGRMRVSTGGGWSPRWSRDGTELFFMSPGWYLIAARVAVDGGLRVLARDSLFHIGSEPGSVPVATGNPGFDAYDVSADGRFLMARPYGQASSRGPTMILVQNFFEELRRLER